MAYKALLPSNREMTAEHQFADGLLLRRSGEPFASANYLGTNFTVPRSFCMVRRLYGNPPRAL
jgi:hypothetical protein